MRHVRDVDWVSGRRAACSRAAAFDALGGWDAGYFMFNEDVDLCKRVHDAGLSRRLRPRGRRLSRDRRQQERIAEVDRRAAPQHVALLLASTCAATSRERAHGRRRSRRAARLLAAVRAPPRRVASAGNRHDSGASRFQSLRDGCSGANMRWRSQTMLRLFHIVRM